MPGHPAGLAASLGVCFFAGRWWGPAASPAGAQAHPAVRAGVTLPTPGIPTRKTLPTFSLRGCLTRLAFPGSPTWKKSHCNPSTAHTTAVRFLFFSPLIPEPKARCYIT